MGCLNSKDPPKRRSENLGNKKSSNIEQKSPEKKRKPLNIVMVGDVGVGKTSLLYRFISDEWTENPEELREKTTVGSDFYSKTIKLNGEDFVLHVWDTGGQERYATMTQSYYRQSDCIIVVFDVSNEDSFETTSQWWKEIDRYSKKEVLRILVGNKVDLNRAVETEKGKEQANSLNAAYFYETSAKNGINCKQLFTEWIQQQK